jgi:predicted RNase H-like nuclease (RuvC/YqgF family)
MDNSIFDCAKMVDKLRVENKKLADEMLSMRERMQELERYTTCLKSENQALRILYNEVLYKYEKLRARVDGWKKLIGELSGNGHQVSL